MIYFQTFPKGDSLMRQGKLAVVVAVGLLVAATAAAQGPGGPPFGGFGGFGGNLAGMIPLNKQLQDELKVSKEQADKLTDAFAKVRDDLKDDLAKLRERDTTPQDREKIMKKMTDGNAKAVDSVLKPEQVKRLHQIENQQAGVAMFGKPDVKDALKLSDKQVEEVATINKDLQKDLRELSGDRPGGFGGFDPESVKKRQDLQKTAMDNVRKVLSDKQKETLKDLTGEPFELRFEGGFPGGPGGFPGGRGGPGGFGQPGQVLAPFVQDQLKLTADQKKKLEELQKEVDGKLDKILTEDQKKQLKDMQQGRPGRGGPPGAPPGSPPDRRD
jgi:Spy/CpxP family protein refolding chaperone